MSASTMPTVQDLREIARHAFAVLRGEQEPTKQGCFADLAFAQHELFMLKEHTVYEEERRRHELIIRGFAP